MLASEVIDKSPVLGTCDDEHADLVGGIRSSPEDPALRSEPMSWFLSRIPSMPSGAIALHHLVLDLVETTCGGWVFVVTVWSSLANG
jgi:hypothetical protein